MHPCPAGKGSSDDQHAWNVDTQQAGLSCMDCHTSYIDWAGDTIKRLRAQLMETATRQKAEVPERAPCECLGWNSNDMAAEYWAWHMENGEPVIEAQAQPTA